MKKKLIVFATALMTSTLSFAATLTSMTNTQVEQTFKNKTMQTIPMAMLNHQLLKNSIQIYFGEDGKLQGRFNKTPANQSDTDTGTWSVNGTGQLCVKWTTWDNAQQTCLDVYKTDNSIIFIGANGDLNSVALDTEIMPGNDIKSQVDLPLLQSPQSIELTNEITLNCRDAFNG